MSGRTTIVLGAKERLAAKKLAAKWGVTPSEAIRRALLRTEAIELQPLRERRRQQRVRAFEALIKAFEASRRANGYDPVSELRRLREDRDAW